MCEPLGAYASRMAAHAVCLDRAATEPEAVADRRVAERLALMADVARTAASVAGLVPVIPETEETTNA